MRRTYISPEFHNNKIYGTYNSYEESNFFGSKMLEIEDFIDIENQDVIYYQKNTGEQIDLSVESTLQSIVYSSAQNKLNNHTLIIDKSQPVYQLNRNTRWILEIKLADILRDYIFSTLKKYRTFEGLKNNMTIEKDVNILIKKYIDNNVMNRYKLESVDLFVDYKDLRRQNILKYKNNWNPKLEEQYKLKRVQSETSSDGSIIKIIFEQEKNSDTYHFDYFYNISFQKI